jgi:glycosyltransferase involved in cell wall biosynthesis
VISDKTIGVVIPAYNEELLIHKVIQTMPEYVDRMIVVNDGSKDRTLEILREYEKSDPRVIVVNHEVNKGLGQSLIDGYLKSAELNMDVTAVMAGDAQMAPDDLCSVVMPIIDGSADYVKGNRLLMENVYGVMPKYRFLGNSVLTLLTKFATGYWHIIDPQCGYTAISLKSLKDIPIATMIKGYGYNAHILYMLNLKNYRVQDVQVKPVYGQEVSKIVLRKYVPSVSKLLASLFLKRVTIKYLVREFHPAFFLYLFSFVCLVPIALPLFIRFLYLFFTLGVAPTTTLIILMFSTMMGFQSLIFAMWMDMEDNKRLRPN